MAVGDFRFRSFAGDEDLGGMYSAYLRGVRDDGLDIIDSFDAFSESFDKYSESLPSKDVIVALSGDNIIGFARVWWTDVLGGARIYSVMSFGPRDYRRELVLRAEARLNELAASHPNGVVKLLETMAVKDSALEGLARELGYSPTRYFFEMIRPLNALPAFDVPEGIAILPVTDGVMHAAWAMTRDAFRDHWSYAENSWTDSVLERKIKNGMAVPGMWLMAKSGEDIVGSVQNYVRPQENSVMGRKRGYVSNVCVSRDWRGRGIAKALLARSLEVHVEAGMEEARLAVDSKNPSGALLLYQSLGFNTVNVYVSLRKPLRT